MKKKNDNTKKSVADKEKGNIKNAANENEKTKKKRKKKKITNDKIENENNVEITEKKDLLDNTKINVYNESDFMLIAKTLSYIEQQKYEIVNGLLKKYYDADKRTPFFYIDISTHKCTRDMFFPMSIEDKTIFHKKSNKYYENSSIYFYNILNNKCLNTIFYSLKEFFKDHSIEHFENCCETMQLTYLSFFILLTSCYSLSKNIKKCCIENLKIIFKIKTYLFEKYIKYTNKNILNKLILLNKVENGNTKNAFFIYETKIINGIINDKKIEFENMTMRIISSNNVDKRYLLSLVIKTKSYEYIHDFLFLDLFKIHILSSPCLSAISSTHDVSTSFTQVRNDHTTVPIALSSVANTFPLEEKENAFSYVFEIEVPADIYTNQELEIFYIDTYNKANCENFFPAEDLYQWGKIDCWNEANGEVPNGKVPNLEVSNGRIEIMEILQGEREGENIDNRIVQGLHRNEKQTSQNYTQKWNEKNCNEEIIACSENSVSINVENEYNVKIRNICTGNKEASLHESTKTKTCDEINLVRVQNEQFTLNGKTYLKFYSSRISNYYISLNSIQNFPYLHWGIKYYQNNVVITLKSQRNKEFIFHINNDGIELQDNGIGVLNDLYNCTLDVYTLLFLMKKKGINFFFTSVEMEKMQKQYNYNLNNDKNAQLLINDILLCFRFMTFYSSHVSSTNKIDEGNLENKTNLKKIVHVHMMGNEGELKIPLNDSLYVEYMDNFCRIVKIETEENEIRFTKNLTKHKSILFCLFELCQLINLNNNKEKTKVTENNMDENNDDDNKNDVMNFQNFLINIFTRNNIEKIKEVMNDGDNLKKNSLQVYYDGAFSENEYNNFLEFTPIVHNLQLFLEITRIVSITRI
ncbi:hypothetical protein, conserved [Plasmodium gonderi]|uniref:Uncharacterized protein n=1 Tax=Plasmodium gonderi TaxID=77519 RepID=A0A1Y1JNN5_PLAGO|nr:hypothetical protein, conserved [Plasmodium gonderi]GAW82442.1 hypothetical protein, conserved [Plasmodium gonderi]